MTRNHTDIVRYLTNVKLCIIIIGMSFIWSGTFPKWIVAGIMFTLLIAITVLIHTRYKDGVQKRSKYHWFYIAIIFIGAIIAYMLTQRSIH